MVKKTDYKKIDILGITLDNFTVRESMMRFDTYIGSTVLNIIETVTMKQLISAGEFTVIKDCLAQADLCIVGDSEILSETGNTAAQRIREVREQDFLHELLKRVVRARKRVFLLAGTKEDTERIGDFIKEQNPSFEEVGSCALEESAEDMDAVVNEINGATPDIVISALDSPEEEEFILAHKDKIGTSVWYGVGTSYDRKQKGIQVGTAVKKLAMRRRLHHSISKYRENE